MTKEDNKVKEEQKIGAISFFEAPITNTVPKQSLSLHQVFKLIRECAYAETIQEIRKNYPKNIARKKNLDYVTFSGTFFSRNTQKQKSSSNLICIDFDHVESGEIEENGESGEYIRLRETLIEDSKLDVRLIFRSPSGRGLKCVIFYDAFKYDYSSYFFSVCNYLELKYGLGKFIDRNGSDVSRACFLSHDEDAFYSNVSTAIEDFDPKEFSRAFIRQEEVQPTDGNQEDIEDLEDAVKWIELAKFDITSGYQKWRDIGFALVDALGETGRSFFHRLSSFHPDYDFEKCEAQFSSCLHSQRKNEACRITKNTFFYYVNRAGWSDFKRDPLPFVSTSRMAYPELIKAALEPARSVRERDLLLLGTVTTLGSCLWNVEGKYDHKWTHPNLYLFIVAYPASGKGILNHCKLLLKDYEASLGGSQPKLELALDGKRKRKKGVPLIHFIPADSSAAGFNQLLEANGEKGMIFETEGDTLAQAFEKEFADYSDRFRRAFEHESITSYRKTEREFNIIEKPRISALLTGTPDQVRRLIPQSANGLLSRFLFYTISNRTSWISPFYSTGPDIKELYEKLSKEINSFLQWFHQCDSVKYEWTEHQKMRFDEFFARIDREYYQSGMYGEISSLRRMGAITFRIGMIFSVLRRYEEGGDTRCVLNSSDEDFETIMELIQRLIPHMLHIQSFFYQNQQAGDDERQSNYFDKLPTEFDRKDILNLAVDLNIPKTTAEKWIAKWYRDKTLRKLERGKYSKS